MFYPVAKSEDVLSNNILLTDCKGVSLALFNLSGKFYALEDACSHDSSSFDMASIEGKNVICPRHGAMFDITTGENLCPPAFYPVKTYPVRVNGDIIEVDIDA